MNYYSQLASVTSTDAETSDREAGGIEPPLNSGGTDFCEKSCDSCRGCGAARALQAKGTERQFLATPDADLQFIADGWGQLPEAVRSAISMLVKANVSNMVAVEAIAQERRRRREGLAMQLVQECRYIIQGCLREEEWQDADQEFFDVIAPQI